MPSVRTARIVGMTTFLAGIFLLILVFILAWQDVHRPLTGTALEEGITLARRFCGFVIMGLVASIVAGRGCQMYGAAGAVETGAGSRSSADNE